MSDNEIEAALEGVLAVARSNFPADTDITISTTGKNSASVRLPTYIMTGILECAKRGRQERKE